jgi:hypothetical protein
MRWTTQTKEVDMRGVGQRNDQRLIHPDRLAELEQLAQDGRDMRAAVQSLQPKKLRMMQIVREGGEAVGDIVAAQGWLEFDSDLGEALLEVQRKRGEEAPF